MLFSLASLQNISVVIYERISLISSGIWIFGGAILGDMNGEAMVEEVWHRV